MSSLPEIGMRPGGETAEKFHPLPQADSSAGQVFPFKNLLEKQMSRREAMGKIGKGAFAAIFAGKMLSEVATPHNASAEANANVAVGEGSLDQDVLQDTEDISTRYMDLPKITVDPELNTDAAPDLLVEKVGLNSEIKPEIYRKNRLGRATFAAFARADALATQYIDDSNPNGSALVGLYDGAREFPEPDIDSFILRMKEAHESGNPLWLNMMATTQSSQTERVWTKVDMTRGIDLNFVANPDGGIVFEEQNGAPVDTYKFRVDEETGQLTMDIFYDNSYARTFNSDMDPQELYNRNFSNAVRKGFMVLSTSLGAKDSENNELFGYVLQNYNDALNKGELFPEFVNLMLGERNSEGKFTNFLFKVQLAGK